VQLPLHVPHAQLAPHVCDPPVPQLWVAPGEHAPVPVHVDHVEYVPPLHVRDCVPQFPHACVSGRVQPTLHVPHAQVASHIWEPPVQAFVSPGLHAPPQSRQQLAADSVGPQTPSPQTSAFPNILVAKQRDRRTWHAEKLSGRGVSHK
jgi:hypothetical protein